LLLEVRRRLADDRHRPRPVQQPVPVMVGAMSTSGLSVAAQHADIVGFAGLRQVPGAPPGTFTVSSAAETEKRVAQVRERADGRRYRSDVLVQAVVLGDPEESAARIAADAPGLTVQQLLDSPFVLLAADAGAAAAELRRRQERYGFTSVTTHQPYLEPLGEVIDAYRSAAR
jgi:alkanesulfonate monooxygenase SsuD/methylene tetrahydromethanopterin reductase-like flavin-dependent oxidoreductase (luciferase family)